MVRFNRLKLCTPGTRFDDIPTASGLAEENTPPDDIPGHFGMNMEPLDYDEPDTIRPVPPRPGEPRYPSRIRGHPDWLGDYVAH